MDRLINNAVVAMVKGGRILLVRQTDREIFVLPGGGIEAGETPAQAAAREVMEEVGSAVVTADLMDIGIFEGESSHGGDKIKITLHCFLARKWAGEPRDMSATDEVEELKWFTMAELADARTSQLFHAQVLPALKELGHFS